MAQKKMSPKRPKARLRRPEGPRYTRRPNPKPKGITDICEKGNYTTIDTLNYSQDICDAEYWYFDSQASQPILAQYNLIIRQLIMQQNKSEEVYQNPLVSIVKNDAIGEDCIGSNSTINLG